VNAHAADADEADVLVRHTPILPKPAALVTAPLLLGRYR
jgi:hypothetical protein